MSTSIMIVRLLICLVIFVPPYCRGLEDRHIRDLYEQGLVINSTNWYLKLNISDLNEEIQKATEKIENRYRLEDKILNNMSPLTIGSPVHGQLIDSMPSKDGNSGSRIAEIILEVTRSLKDTYCLKHGLSDIQCAKDLMKVNLTGTTLGEMCMSEYYIDNSCVDVVYDRTADGYCNNRKRKYLGKANTPYKRLLFPAYTDGIYEMPNIYEQKLPSPRSLSINLVKDEISTDPEKTMFVAYWMMFIAHDLSQTGVSTMGKENRFVSCCDNDKSIQYTMNKNIKSCKPIPIPDDDRFFKPEPHDCMNYVRSRPAVRSDCTFGPTEQMNQVTHYLDASMIYGVTEEHMLSLRQNMSFGRMIEIDPYMPGPLSLSTPLEISETKACQNGVGTCFKVGDIRENGFPQLTALHALFIREHNRVALEIHNNRPSLNDEELFREARYIVTAIIQEITYWEWLPTLLGEKYVKEHRLSIEENYYNIPNKYYDDNADPSVSNVFATTILPVAYSMISNNIRLSQEDIDLEELRSYDSLTLKEYYNQPVELLKKATNSILKGLTMENPQKVDMLFTQAITNHLYNIGPNNSFGMDIVSLYIQQGRDHGIPSYTQFRKYCGLKDIKNVQDLSEIMMEGLADKLLKQYKSWDDIDLLVGVLSEKHAEDAMVGPTMRCIIGEQFVRTRYADRFFYEVNGVFTTHQMVYFIRNYSLKTVICRNTDMEELQQNVFLKPTEMISCTQPNFMGPYLTDFYNVNKPYAL